LEGYVGHASHGSYLPAHLADLEEAVKRWECFAPSSLTSAGVMRFNLLVDYWNTLEGLIHLAGGCSEEWRQWFIEQGLQPVDPRKGIWE
jgi:hypothetical protein